MMDRWFHGTAVGAGALMLLGFLSLAPLHAQEEAAEPEPVAGDDKKGDDKKEEPKEGEAKDDQEKEKEKKDKPEEPTAPEHDVTLSEEEDVLRLLRKARKSREEAEKDPESWPECVKAYADILSKYPNTVYLHRWSGDKEEKARAYGLGVYRSTAEMVNQELATLPQAGLAVYRAVNDPAARSLMVEAQENLDERRMEQVAQAFFTSSWGDDALQWLAALSYDRGAYRQAVTRLARIANHPDPSMPRVSILAQLYLAYVKAGMKKKAEGALADLEEALKNPDNGTLEVAHKSGADALALLKSRLAQVEDEEGEQDEAVTASWDTYFGNAIHNKPLPAKKEVGVLKWSESIVRLLGAPKGTKDTGSVEYRGWSGQNQKISMLDTHLAVRGGYFYLAGYDVVAAHSINNPNPDRPQFWYPSTPPAPRKANPQNRNWAQKPVWHPHFVTLGKDHLYVVQGPEPQVHVNQWWGRNQQKQSPNWLVAVGKSRGGTMGIESGSLLWTLESSHDSVNTSKDKEWLKSVFLVSAPTYANGALYVMAVSDQGATREAYLTCFDAPTGRLLWKRMLCASTPMTLSGLVQPDLGLPVAVDGDSVYCVTNLGAIACTDAATGQIRWIRIYDRLKTNNNNNMGQNMARSTDCWGPNPPLLAEGMLICTPQDSPYLYALDPATGRRVWRTERVTDAGLGAPGDAERLKHILGVSNGRLVLSGRDVLFIELKGGRRQVRVSIRDTYTIVGRGVATDSEVFIPTDKALLTVDASLTGEGDKQKPIGKLVSDTPKWEDADREAGNLFVSGDVMFSVSATHVNAYFVLEDVEKKIVARIQADPKDLNNYVELGDVRHRAKAWDKAIEAFDQGLAAVPAEDKDPKTAKLAEQLKARKFEAFFAAGEEAMAAEPADPAGAYARFESGLGTAATPDQPVRALWKMADARLATDQAADAVMLYQRMLAEHGEVVYSFSEKSSSKSGVFAQRRIAQIKEKHPQATAQLDTQARQALTEALGKGVDALRAFINTWPNAEAYGDGLLALADRLKAAAPEEAATYYRRYLTRYRTAPKTPEVLAQLAKMYEKTGKIGAAKSLLRQLTRNDTFKAASITVAGAAQNAGAWAAGKLEKDPFKVPPTSAQARLGDGKLDEMWMKSMGDNVVGLEPNGLAPKAMTETLLFVENAKNIVARKGIDGEELWTPRPVVPSGFRAHLSLWAGDLLVLSGKHEVVAYDSNNKGAKAWTLKVNPNDQVGGGDIETLQVIEQRVVVSQKGGLLVVAHAKDGNQLWQIPAPGGDVLGLPALGEGFIALGQPNQKPTEIAIFELETGDKRLDLKIDEQALQQPVCAVGEAVYAVDGANRVHAFDAVTGKLLWQYELGNNCQHLYADYDMVIAVLKDMEMVALDTTATDDNRRLLWKAIAEGTGTFAGLVVDRDEVFLASRQNNRRGVLSAYKARGGKFQWKVETAGGGVTLRSNLAENHLLLTQSTFDTAGQMITACGLVDRRYEGKLTWTVPLSSNRSLMQLFDGGVAVLDGRSLKGYLVPDPARAANDIEALKTKAQGAPADVALKMQLAQAQVRQGEHAQAMKTLLDVLATPDLDEKTFGEAFDRFSTIRGQAALTDKATITFKKLAKAPVVDGKIDDWAGVEPVKLDSWRHVFLAGEEDRRIPFKKEAWKDAADLSVAFYGGYDEKNLYIAAVVKDQVHQNKQKEGVNCWNGDSLQLAFDLEQDSRQGFYGNDYQLGFAKATDGDLLRFRWVERGKYLMRPLEADPKRMQAQAAQNQPWEKALEGAVVQIVRDEATKETRYEAVLPLAYLSLEPKAGAKFGFTFMVNDIDQEVNVEKGMAPSPGIWDPKHPGKYAVGEFGP